MLNLNRFREAQLAERLLSQIKNLAVEPVSLMEVCGTHTMAISQSGIRSLLPKSLKLLSGPGCPVCVTPLEDIDSVIELAKMPSVILTTFGDMMRVPGSKSSLERAKAEGSDIRVVYSPLDSIKFALQNPEKEIVFVGVGFETTSPTIAATILKARENKLKNFFVYPAFKTIPKAMGALLEMGKTKIDGFICPGHVSTIIGSEPYEFIPQQFGVPCVITGFEPIDVLEGILMLLKQTNSREPKVEIQYRRCVKPEGNLSAKEMLKKVFKETDASWRAIGTIPETGLTLREEFEQFDATKRFKIEVKKATEPKGCLCGNILIGVAEPKDCKLFGKGCTPTSPIGPCMVSSEGACAAWYKYGEAR
ncbi:MAG: hydrogenase formation protein HypD [Candidatus Edwardsbacteria bacterium]